MGEGHEQPDKQPRPNDATVIGDDATVIGGEAGGMPAGPMPETIAGYAIKGAIGAGGMGSVYLAQQESPKRDVAIKVMNAGAVSRKAMRRFEFEAQTLGKLQHPAIAQIYEAGTYDDGSGARPFFAMEYVAGAKELNDYVADNDIDPRTRLELFRAACEGVEYGHRRGVIHRDLKPGNILVDEDGNPKIIDFGVARSTDSDSVSATLATEAGQLIGTLQYMSPEQVELDPGELDTRSDVYALGVMLYELLIGRLPYDLTGTSLTQAASRIREIQPKRLGEINANLKGDLETICLKALEKDREQRYQSVNDLAEDVRRYLADEPIMARPPTRAEQIRRFIRKNKAASVATCVVAAALIAATTISVVFAVEAGRQRDQASQQRDAAEHARQEADTQRTLAEEKTVEVQKQAEDMQVMVNFQARQLSSIDVTEMGESLRQEIVRELELEPADAENVDFVGASTRLLLAHIFKPTIESINTRYVDQPVVQARLFQTLAKSMWSLGLQREAIEPQTRAVDLRTEHLGREHPLTLRSLRWIADFLYEIRMYEEALVYEEELLEIRRRTLGDEHVKTLAEMNHLANTYYSLDMYDKAEQFKLEVFEILRRIRGEDHSETIIAMKQLGDLYRAMNQLDKAYPYYRDALALRQMNPWNLNPATLESMEDMGKLLLEQGKLEEAEPYFMQVLDGRRKALGDVHHATLDAITSMGELLHAQGEYDEAFAHFREVHALLRKAHGDMHPETLEALVLLAFYLDRSDTDEEAALGLYLESLEGYRSIGDGDDPAIAFMLDMITNHLIDSLKRPEEAMPYLQELVAMQRRMLGDDHPETLDTLKSMGSTLYSMGKFDEADPYYAEYLERNRRLRGDEHSDTVHAIYLMGRVLRKQGEFDESEKLYIECLETRRRTLGEEDPKTVAALGNLATLYSSQGMHEDAIPYYKEQLELRRRLFGEDEPGTLKTLNAVAMSLYSAKKYGDAEPYFTELLAKQRRLLGDDDPNTLKVMNTMGIIVLAQGRPDEAEPYFVESMAGRQRVLGKEDPATLSTVNNLALLNIRQGRMKEAMPLLLQVLEGRRGALGPAHPKTIESLKTAIGLFEALQIAEPDAGHDATAAKYQAQLDAINAGLEEPAAP